MWSAPGYSGSASVGNLKLKRVWAERWIMFIFMDHEIGSGGGEDREGTESLGSSRNNVGRLITMCRYSKTLQVTDSWRKKYSSGSYISHLTSPVAQIHSYIIVFKPMKDGFKSNSRFWKKKRSLLYVILCNTNLWERGEGWNGCFDYRLLDPPL